MKKLLIGLVAVSLLLASCGSKPVEIPTATPVPIQLPTRTPRPTATPLPIEVAPDISKLCADYECIEDTLNKIDGMKVFTIVEQNPGILSIYFTLDRPPFTTEDTPETKYLKSAVRIYTAFDSILQLSYSQEGITRLHLFWMDVSSVTVVGSREKAEVYQYRGYGIVTEISYKKYIKEGRTAEALREFMNEVTPIYVNGVLRLTHENVCIGVC